MPRNLRSLAALAYRRAQSQDARPATRKVPRWLKLLYTLFVCVVVPSYWSYYGLADSFLWFSGIALLATVPALWLESRFLVSMQTVSVLLLEMFWTADFLIGLPTGGRFASLSGYMFQPEIPLFLRGLSLFHIWLPVLLVWLVWRLGYDRRAWLAQTVLAWLLLPLCYFVTDPSDNVNWVFGLGEPPRQWLPPGIYLALLMVLFPVCVYLPTHLVLRRLFAPRDASSRPLPPTSKRL